MPRNPFTPGFGSQPPVLIGRDDVLLDVRDGLIEGPGSPLRALKVTGPRGSGKTTVLGAAADVALEQGWIPLSVTASPQMHEELLALAVDRTAHFTNKPGRRLSGLELAGFGFTLEDTPPPQRDAIWRIAMERILDVVEERDSGLMFIVDEVSDRHPALQTFGKRFQHLKSEQRNVSLIAAGLPLNVSEFESLKDTTFIRRAIPHEIGDLPVPMVREALRETFEEYGKRVEPEALRIAADATEGFPFLVQLVGYHIWRLSSNPIITINEVEAGIAKARHSIGATVHSSSMADLSPADKKFLIAMAVDNGPSKMSAIISRTGWSTAQAGVYRSRLINAGLIRPADRHGYVDFVFPTLREYLRDHSETLSWTATD